jgi:putative Holliday junction resolvase
MPEQPAGTVLAFDYGAKRIGVAVGNTVTREARALEIIQNLDTTHRFAAVERLIAEWQPIHMVVGMPYHPEGPDGEQPAMGLARRFGNQLHGRFGVSVSWVDESFSSVAARSAGAQRGALDAEAARVILQQYFDEQATA